MHLSVTLPLILVPLAAAHGAVTSYVLDGKEYPGYEAYAPQYGPPTIQRQWKSYDPIFDVESAAMTCNGGTSADLVAQLAPGAKVTAKYKQWTHRQGPVTVWMYACEGPIASCDGKGKKWFKIDEKGLTVQPSSLASNNWGTSIVVDKLEWTLTIPKDLKPGFYLLRHELLALHQSNTPQFYPECAQIEITGSGTAIPAEEYLTSIPGYAKKTDSNINVDIYSSTATTFKVHGPPVWNT